MYAGLAGGSEAQRAEAGNKEMIFMLDGIRPDSIIRIRKKIRSLPVKSGRRTYRLGIFGLVVE